MRRRLPGLAAGHIGEGRVDAVMAHYRLATPELVRGGARRGRRALRVDGRRRRAHPPARGDGRRRRHHERPAALRVARRARPRWRSARSRARRPRRRPRRRAQQLRARRVQRLVALEPLVGAAASSSASPARGPSAKPDRHRAVDRHDRRAVVALQLARRGRDLRPVGRLEAGACDVQRGDRGLDRRTARPGSRSAARAPRRPRRSAPRPTARGPGPAARRARRRAPAPPAARR